MLLQFKLIFVNTNFFCFCFLYCCFFLLRTQYLEGADFPRQVTFYWQFFLLNYFNTKLKFCQLVSARINKKPMQKKKKKIPKFFSFFYFGVFSRRRARHPKNIKNVASSAYNVCSMSTNLRVSRQFVGVWYGHSIGINWYLSGSEVW
jgi:hypothetical protein